VPLILRTLTLAFSRHTAFFDTPAVRLTVLWLLLFGAAVAVVVIVSESNPLVAGVPAVLLGVGYGAWLDLPSLRAALRLPWAIVEPIAFSFGPTAWLVVGMLTGAAAWGLWRTLRASRLGVHDGNRTPGPRYRLLVGAAAGVAIVAVLPSALRTLSNDLHFTAAIRDFGSLRPAVLRMILLGVVVGAAVILSKVSPLATAVPAVVVALAYATAPHLQLLGPVGWIPRSLREQVTFTIGPSPAVVIGVLAAAAAWNTWVKLRSSTGSEEAQVTAMPSGGTPSPAGQQPLR
jgi:hypothetical protein